MRLGTATLMRDCTGTQGGALSFDARVRAREVARAQPALRLFFDLEREQHPGSGEIEEPPVLS